MSRPEHPTSSHEFGAGYWEDRYRAGEGASRHAPSPSLVTETSDLPPGQALDAGCGNGADATWLAARGWHVTAIDVSATALDRAQENARALGEAISERIDWVHADLTTWTPGEHRFDLVTSHYVHLPGPPKELFRRLASWVAPGGTLLVVGHDHNDDHDDSHTDGPDHPHGHRPAAGSRVRTQQVTANLPEGQWRVLVAQSRTHTVQRPDGAGTVTLHNAVVRALRNGPSHP